MAKAKSSGASPRVLLLRENTEKKLFIPAGEWDPGTFPPAPGDSNPGKSRQKINKGFEIKAYNGAPVFFNRKLFYHWYAEKDYGEKQIRLRLAKLGMAESTVKKPREVWVQRKQVVYIQAFRQKNGDSIGCLVFVRKNGVAKTYFPKKVKKIDTARKGKRIK